MPDWRVHAEFDPRLGVQTLKLGLSRNSYHVSPDVHEFPTAQSPPLGENEVPVKPLIREVIDAIERRHLERAHLPATKVWPDAVELVRRATWESPDSPPQALFFDASVNPVELYADAVWQRAGAKEFGEWTESTWVVLKDSFEDMMQRPMRFFLGLDQSTIRRAKHEGYAIILVRP